MLDVIVSQHILCYRDAARAEKLPAGYSRLTAAEIEDYLRICKGELGTRQPPKGPWCRQLGRCVYLAPSTRWRGGSSTKHEPEPAPITEFIGQNNKKENGS